MLIDNNSDLNPGSMATEIHAFMYQVFPNCKINSRYYPEKNAWHFQMRIKTQTNDWSINPPKGCCLMGVKSMNKEVEFQIILFVQDFINIHAQKFLN